MNNDSCITGEPVAAIATALAPAALGIVRLSGDNSIQLLSQVFSRPQALAAAPGNSAVYGWIYDNGTPVDEVMVTVYRAPKSFTGEESAEIICHGGVMVVTAIYALLLRHGFRAAHPGEFSFRSFSNGKTDLSKAEAVREIIDAKTGEAREKAAGRLAGNLRSAITAIKESIVESLAAIEVELDYPEDEATATAVFKNDMIDRVCTQLISLADTWQTEKLYQEGAKVVLCGRTNAGKSSIFNMLLKEERAIVSDIHGTTRDWIESTVSCGGIPVRLFDTAGLRETDDRIEKIGLQHTHSLAEDADVILYAVDSTSGLTAEDSSFMTAAAPVPVIGIWNKTDCTDTRPVPADGRTWIAVSARTAAGFQDITAAITGILRQSSGTGSSNQGLGSLRQREAVLAAVAHLKQAQSDMAAGQPLDILAESLMAAVQALGEITGETVADDILAKLFSQFCVGK